LAAASAWALARVNDKDEAVLEMAVTRLVAALKDTNQGTRVLAAKALVDLQPPAERVAPALADALSDADPEVVANVVDALAAHGDAVLPRAVNALKNQSLRLPAIMLLQRLGPKAKEAVPALVAIVKDDQREEVRHAIIDALEAIGTASKDSLPALISMLTDDNLDIRRAATFALGKIGPPAKSALPAIRTNFDTREELRPVSIWAMVRISPDDDKVAAKAVPLLIAALRREEGFVRFEAAETLGLIGPRARAAVPALEAAKEDPDDFVRQAVVEALTKIKG
jgi:HEAT repeat protein